MNPLGARFPVDKPKGLGRVAGKASGCRVDFSRRGLLPEEACNYYMSSGGLEFRSLLRFWRLASSEDDAKIAVRVTSAEVLGGEKVHCFALKDSEEMSNLS